MKLPLVLLVLFSPCFAHGERAGDHVPNTIGVTPVQNRAEVPREIRDEEFARKLKSLLDAVDERLWHDEKTLEEFHLVLNSLDSLRKLISKDKDLLARFREEFLSYELKGPALSRLRAMKVRYAFPTGEIPFDPAVIFSHFHSVFPNTDEWNKSISAYERLRPEPLRKPAR